MPDHAFVIGGGFAGAAAASALTEAGVGVTLIEQRPRLGGRTHSLRDGVTKDEVDNGQHLFMGCYRDTRRFLRRLRVEDRLQFFPALDIPFAAAGGRRARLRVSGFPFSGGLLGALLRFGALSMRDKWSLARGFAAFRLSRRSLADLTVAQWLDRLKQTPGARRAFWTPLCLATLNERPEAACAQALAVVLRQGLLGSAQDRALGYSAVSLSKLWPVELAAYLKRQGGLAAFQQSVTGFHTAHGRVTEILMAGGERIQADAVVCAVPLPAFLRICPWEIRQNYQALEPAAGSDIVSVNLWFQKPPFEEAFTGLLDVDAHWAFNRHRLWAGRGARPGYVSLVMSAAAGSAGRDSREIMDRALADLRRCFPDFKEEPVHGTVVWERPATPSPTPHFWRSRPPVETALDNFFLAGDWVDVGLPPTIEAACRSGHRAAEGVLRRLKEQKQEKEEEVRKEGHVKSGSV